MTIVLQYVHLMFSHSQENPLPTLTFVLQRIRPHPRPPVRLENWNVPCLTDDPASMSAASSTSYSQTFVYPAALLIHKMLKKRASWQFQFFVGIAQIFFQQQLFLTQHPIKSEGATIVSSFWLGALIWLEHGANELQVLGSNPCAAIQLCEFECGAKELWAHRFKTPCVSVYTDCTTHPGQPFSEHGLSAIWKT